MLSSSLPHLAVCTFRVIKDFIIQAGDPTGTGDGGDSIYGGLFKARAKLNWSEKLQRIPKIPSLQNTNRCSMMYDKHK